MKVTKTSKIVLIVAVTGILFGCRNKEQDGYSDEIETLEYPADDSTKTVTDTSEISGFSTTNKSTKGSSGTDKGGTGTATGPGESPKDGATYSGRTEKYEKNTSASKKTDSKNENNEK